MRSDVFDMRNLSTDIWSIYLVYLITAIDHNSIAKIAASYSFTNGVTMFKTILVPTDGSTLSDKAITAAIEFAKFCNGKVIGLSVAEPYPFSPMAESANGG